MRVTLEKLENNLKKMKGFFMFLLMMVIFTMNQTKTSYADYGPGIPEEEWSLDVRYSEHSDNEVEIIDTISDNSNMMIQTASTQEYGPGVTPIMDMTPDSFEASVPLETTPTLFLELSPESKEVLCRIVEAEVTGVGGEEVLMAKFRVARVVINRVLDPRFPNTVENVVYQRGQFGPISDGRFWQVSITDMTRQAVDMALDSSIPDDIPGALYFNGKKGHKSRKLQLILTDGVGHKFYRYK